MIHQECDKVGHDGSIIVEICLNPDCRNSTPLCYHCIRNNHQDCDKQKYLIKSRELQGKFFDELFEIKEYMEKLQQVIKKELSTIVSQINQYCQKIREYQEYPGLTKLNEIGQLFKKNPKNEFLEEFDKTKTKIKKLLDEKYALPKQRQREGIQLLIRGELQQAMELFNQLIEDCPNDSISYECRGKTLYLQKKYQAAICDCNISIEHNQNNFNALCTKGEALCCLKQYDEAVTCFDKALLIEEQKENENVIIMKGEALFNNGQLQEALNCYETVLGINRENQLAQKAKIRTQQKLQENCLIF